MPTIGQQSTGRTQRPSSSTIAGASQATRPARRTATKKQPKKKEHRSFLGGLVHDITHPGVAELPLLAGPLAAVYAPFYLAGHAPKGPVRKVGHVGQALISSPYFMAAHPKATASDIAHYPTQAAEGVTAMVVSPFEEAIRGSLPPMMGGRPRTRGGVSPGLPKAVSTYGGVGSRLVKAEKRNAKALLKATIKDYKERYGEDWKIHAAQNPTYNFADAMTIVGTAVPLAAGARAWGALARAGELEAFGGRTLSELSAVEKAKAIKMEYHEPGRAATGTPETRRISYKPPTGERVFADQPFSRAPLRRGAQRVADALSEAFPNMPLAGAEKRVTKANHHRMARDIERTSVVPGLDEFHDLQGPLGVRLGLEGQLVQRPSHLIGNVDEKRWADDLASHNAHVDAELQKFHDILEEEYKRPPEGGLPPDSVRDAMTDAMKQQRLDEVKAAIKAKPNKQYHRAYEAAKYISKLSRYIHLDEAGFTAHTNDLKRATDRVREYEALEAAGKLERPVELERARNDAARIRASLEDAISGTADVLDQRQGLLRRYVDVNRPGHHAPERANLIEQARAAGMPDQHIAAGITAYDTVAAKFPGGPEAFWRDRVGTSEGALLKFIASRGDRKALLQEFPEFGPTDLIEGQAHAPAGTSAYYSDLQRQVADMDWGKRGVRQAGQVRAEMKKRNLQEYKNLELDNFFDQYDKNDMISQADLQTHMATPLNLHNIREHHFVNTEGANEAFYRTLWGGEEFGDWVPLGVEWSDELLSRTPKAGEYHEIAFQFPEGRDLPYEGGAADHWRGLKNVTAHVRFQVFEENGVRKLLVEEVQSDWIKDARTQRLAGQEFDPTGSESARWLSENLRLRNEITQKRNVYNDLTMMLRQIRRKQEDLPMDARDPNADAAIAHFEEAVGNALTELETAENAHGAWLAENKRPGRTPPPKMTAAKAQRLAINRILRHAAENGVDQVIITDRHTQHARNLHGFLEHEMGAAVDEWEGVLMKPPETYTLGGDPVGGGGRTPAEARALAESMIPEQSWLGRIYEEDLPKILQERIGVEGKMVDDAYQGQLQTQVRSGRKQRSATGDMRGTVFDLTEEAKAKAVEQDVLYQRQPDWKSLPKGAAEFFEDGRSAVHLFEGADLSTMMHELFHIAMPDMDPEHQAVLNRHYGAGKEMDEWDNAAHENAARDFEKWLRSGASPNRLVAEAFARIGQWMRELFGKLKEEGALPQEVQDAFASIFEEQRTPESEIPDFYMPHRSRAPDTQGANTSRGIPRNDLDIGDLVPPREPQYKRNELRLLRNGMINFDPRLLIDHMNRLLMLQRANSIRQFLLEHAEPLYPGTPPDLASQYVIKKAGTSTDRPLYDALEAAEDPEALRQEMKQRADDWLTDDQQKIDLWRDEESRRLGSGRARQLYKIDKELVDNLMIQLTGKTPGAATKTRGQGALALVDAALDTQRGLLLYGNPGFYTANMLGNAFMLTMSDPRAWRNFRWAWENGMKQALGTGADHRWKRIANEMGRGRTSGPLSQQDLFFDSDSARLTGAIKNLKKPRRGEKRTEIVGRGTSKLWHEIGQHAGAIVDDTFRTMAWKQSARKRGVKTDAEIDKLLDDATQRDDMAAREAAQKKLHAIRDEAEQLMLDFDSMSAFEKSWLSRFIFLYPFLRASVKYPIIFGGERPLTAAAMMQAGKEGGLAADQILGPRPAGLPRWAESYARMFGGYLPVGSMAPTQPVGDLLSTITNIGQNPITGITAPLGMTSPLTQLAIESLMGRNQYGRAASFPEIVHSDLSLPPWMAYAILRRKPSRLYSDRDFLHTLLRSSRLYPFQVNEQYGNEVQGGG